MSLQAGGKEGAGRVEAEAAALMMKGFKTLTDGLAAGGLRLVLCNL